ncbi:hypothetical protein ABZ746_39135 [Streptomyces sp. NPDC020096]
MVLAEQGGADGVVVDVRGDHEHRDEQAEHVGGDAAFPALSSVL